MRVYHGSDTQFEQIDLNKCKFGKDFGRGFYVTKLQDQAVTMAGVPRWIGSEKQQVKWLVASAGSPPLRQTAGRCVQCGRQCAVQAVFG
jgi:hypothetical protein